MVNPDKLFGRLSNRMFLMAAWYAHSKDNNIPFFAQDEKYFEKYADEIRALYSEGIAPNSIDRVAIHVRRAKNPINPDEPAYSDNGFYADLGHHLHEDMLDNYYIRAMEMFPNERFTVFSDDIPWCIENFMPIKADIEFSEGKSAVDDLNQMACHKSIIIANSSMSWWSAWLGKHDKQVVVAPKQWFSNPEDEKLIGIPKDWIRI